MCQILPVLHINKFMVQLTKNVEDQVCNATCRILRRTAIKIPNIVKDIFWFFSPIWYHICTKVIEGKYMYVHVYSYLLY